MLIISPVTVLSIMELKK